ncbi:hypothetical protein NPIL_172741 [Nephila pilipes]|uniref:Uncharacterized protein n=1 Tax=Nephila pilipes TaxID=299642 RepID=A0A8X6NRN6_NEPPI|nr:hypothetical protein NPIL_172741 [Nephila pilipes]
MCCHCRSQLAAERKVYAGAVGTKPVLRRGFSIELESKDGSFMGISLSDKGNECVIIQRLFQRKDTSFRFVPERVMLNGENLGKLSDSYELVFECGKTNC